MPVAQPTGHHESMSSAPALPDISTSLPLNGRVVESNSLHERHHSDFVGDEDRTPFLNRQRSVGLDMETVGTQRILPSDAWTRLEIYFKYNNCWLPTIPKLMWLEFCHHTRKAAHVVNWLKLSCCGLYLPSHQFREEEPRQTATGNRHITIIVGQEV